MWTFFFLFYRCFNCFTCDIMQAAGLRLLKTGSPTAGEKWEWRGVDICAFLRSTVPATKSVFVRERHWCVDTRVCYAATRGRLAREGELFGQLCIPVTSHRKPGGLVRDSVINRDRFRVDHSWETRRVERVFISRDALRDFFSLFFTRCTILGLV